MQGDAAPTSSSVFHPPYPTEASVAAALVDTLASLGVEQAFGVVGGAIGVLFDALAESAIAVRHFRHEAGAAFAATEAYFAGGKPTAVFTTTGPGTLNALTGITAARWEGAKVVLLSGTTGAAQRGRWATQETSAYTLPQDGLYGTGPLFDFALRLEHGAELPEIARRLATGLSRPGGFVAHIGLPIALQTTTVEVPRQRHQARSTWPTISSDEAAACARRLTADPFAIWVGFGARHAAGQLRTLAERADARVYCSPRAKGIFPESHRLFVGVTGLGGHETVAEYVQQFQPRWVLVLGTKLGEATSFWDHDLLPVEGFIHVDIDSTVPGTAYPSADTFAVHAEIGEFLDALLPHFPPPPTGRVAPRVPHRPWPEVIVAEPREPVRPQALMTAIQQRVVDGSDALVMSESGNAFAWCNHFLRFEAPGRYRVSTLFGSMGHCAAGVVGAALARGGKAVAVVGDGSMLMNSEISTAVQYSAQAVWIVLNDAGYGMCDSGQKVLGLASSQLAIPRVDFASLARSVGADGIEVRREDDLAAALDLAMSTTRPFVVDVRIDPNEASPLMERFESLLRQGSSKSVAGWDS